MKSTEILLKLSKTTWEAKMYRGKSRVEIEKMLTNLVIRAALERKHLRGRVVSQALHDGALSKNRPGS